ncbi:MBL fold metallo-hydrolase [Thalassotalea castellviae]|uniref:MBL fold metallo-hydrolase n=1 Tax=Thalassotalea castellviae TaxID=3075612 RepID=A0ABU2ZY61_9GAMM|nr:MBL fold metallo-hydrolase [Thalassotalea sp. W431]MDT0602495.1 MBL fold metallo-hydrolase [Thalassotalea sp. W431]
MKITFYGVRGSTPVSGEDSLVLGGHTSCVYVTSNKGDSLILDSGTGIVALGKKLLNTSDDINLLLTHNHWDHIQGFPFFLPIYQENRHISIVTGNVDYDDKDAILTQMSGSTHPVKYQDLPSIIQLDTELAKQDAFSLASFEITTQPLSHPDGGTAYCLHADNQKVAYVTDNELSPVSPPVTSWQEWLAFIDQADVLIHDAQYLEKDMPLKQGWGHSTVDQVVELALQAKVKRLYFISHDPARSDHELLALEATLRTKYQDKLAIEFAREGTQVELPNTV